MALVPAAIYRRVQAADYRADELVAKPFSVDDLRSSVDRWLKRPGAKVSTPEPRAPLSSEDLFGDILVEVETAMESQRTKRGLIDDDLERKLERTLSGLLEVDRPRATAPSGTTAPANPRSEIDQLLDKTLGNLANSRSKRPTPAATKPHSPAVAAAPSVVSPPQVVIPPRKRVPSTPTVSVLDGNPDHFATRKIPTMPHLAATAEPPPVEPPPVEPLPVEPLPVEPPAPGESDTEGERFGEYALLERIAVGGMAEVWRARRTGVEGFQKTLAIKKILSHLTGTPDIVSMLVDEAKLAAQLSHDNIIQIYDLGKVENDFFIAMELVDGMDLRSILAAALAHELPLPFGHALWIAARLAHALDHAHRKQGFDGRDLGIVHRDVSPQNVLIGTEGEIKLCDFGIARAVSRVDNTQMGALKGKLQYMSPEQAWGREVDSRTDIFSLGAVLFEMLTGAKLFGGDSEISILDSVRDCQVPTPSALRAEIPREAEVIVMRALAKAPEDRYQRAGDMAADLDDLLRGLEPQPSAAALAAFVARLNATEPSTTARSTEAAAPPSLPVAEPQSQPQPSTPSLAEESAPAAAPAVDSSANQVASQVVSLQEETAAETPRATEFATATANVGPLAADEPLPQAEPTVEPESEQVATEAAYDLLAEEGSTPRRRWLPWVMAALILVAAAAVWLAFQRRGEVNPETTPTSSVPASPVTPAASEPALDLQRNGDDSTNAETTISDSGEVGTTTPAEAIVSGSSEDAADTGVATTSDEPADDVQPALDPDIEQMVTDEIERRAEKLRRNFERERKALQDELDKAQKAAEAIPEAEGEGDDTTTEGTSATPPPPPAGGNGTRIPRHDQPSATR